MTIPLLYLDGSPNPLCEWVLKGEGEAFPMWDGLPANVDQGDLFRWTHGAWRRVTVSDAEWCEAWARLKATGEPPDGGYELCGPGIRQNPHGFQFPVLVRHEMAPIVGLPRVSDYDGMAEFLGRWPYEGVVWVHEDGRRAKLRKRDVGVTWP